MLFAAIFLSIPGFLLACHTYPPGQEKRETLNVVMDQLPAEFALGDAPGVAKSSNAVIEKIQSAVNRALWDEIVYQATRKGVAVASIPRNAATATVSYPSLYCAGTVGRRWLQSEKTCTADGTCCEVTNGIVTGIMSPGARRTSSVPSRYRRGQVHLKIASVELSKLNRNTWNNMVNNVQARLRGYGGGLSHIRISVY